MFFEGSERASGAMPRCGSSPATTLLIRRMRGSYFNCAAAEVMSAMFSPYTVTVIVELSWVSTVAGWKLTRAIPRAGAPTAGAMIGAVSGGAVAGGPGSAGAVATGAVAGGPAVRVGAVAATVAGAAACAMAA